jgi:hypothetical protein
MPLVYLSEGYIWFINAQIAFLSSSVVILASMFSYQYVVKKGLKAGAGVGDNRDTIHKLEDPYDLYDEDMKEEEKELDLKEVVAEERAKLKKNRRSIWESTKDVKSSFSLYRIGAYTTLVLGFFYLNGSNSLTLFPYLIALGIPPIITVFILMKKTT